MFRFHRFNVVRNLDQIICLNKRRSFVTDLSSSLLFLTFLSGFILGCDSNMKFSAIESPVINDPLAQDQLGQIETVFKLSEQEENLIQESLEKNITTISFQIKKSDGSLLSHINSEDLIIEENKSLVPQFNLTKNSFEFKQTVDIVFAVDVTGSMTDTIESAKLRLVNFVKASRASGYHTRMCLITFGDYTVQKCDRFYDNNPSDAATESQVTELITEITKLKSLRGPNDPGGTDLIENPMRALIDAANSPWGSQNQRFLILITDNGFAYAPDNRGQAGSLAPFYTEVKKAIKDSQMKVFAATPSLAGYDKKFRGEPGIVEYSQGEWFDFSKLISGTITLDTILNQILNQVNTTFVAQFIADEIPGLNPSWPLNKRDIQVKVKNEILGTIQSVQMTSNLPEGRKEYKKQFKLSSKKIKKNSVKVYVNNIKLNSGYNLTNNGEIEFDIPPAAASILKIKFQHELLKDSLQLSPITLNASADAKSVTLILNGILANSDHYSISETLDKRLVISINDSALSEEDLYGLRQLGELKVEVKYKSK